MSRRLRTEAAWRARLAQLEAEHAEYRLETDVLLETLGQFLEREHGQVVDLGHRLAAEREAANEREVQLAAQLREQQVQTARWRERCETVARMEESEYRERCRLTLQLRALGHNHVVTEPQGVR